MSTPDYGDGSYESISIAKVKLAVEGSGMGRVVYSSPSWNSVQQCEIDAKHMVDSHNALAGIDDPEKWLGEVREAMAGIVARSDCWSEAYRIQFPNDTPTILSFKQVEEIRALLAAWPAKEK